MTQASRLGNASKIGPFFLKYAVPISQKTCRATPDKTRLLRRAQELQKPALGGLRMLILQAAAAQEIWYGARFREDQLQEIEERLAQVLRKDGSKE